MFSKQFIAVSLAVTALAVPALADDVELLYWFDGSSVPQGRAATLTEVDVSDLGEGVHSLRVVATDGEGRMSPTVTRHFVRVPQVSGGVSLWLDDAVARRWTLPAGMAKTMLDVSGLSYGIHLLHILPDDGKASNPVSRVFFKVPNDRERLPLTCVYLVDGEPFFSETRVAAGGVLQSQFDVSTLPMGLHRLEIVMIANDVIFNSSQRFFLRAPHTDDYASLKVCYSIDGAKPVIVETVPPDGIYHLDIDVAALPVGLHQLTCQLTNGNNLFSEVSASNFFIRTVDDTDYSELKLWYAIDDGEPRYASPSVNKDLYHIDLDVDTIDEGLHMLTYRLVGTYGHASALRASYFLKTSGPGNGLTSYSYWLNDSIDRAVTVKLDEPLYSCRLITDLDVKQMPLRSSDFRFAVEDGVPVTYAVNDLKVRLHDTAGRWVEADGRFYDVRTRTVVPDTVLLVPDTVVTKPCPQQNEILWYRLIAHHGDSISLRADRACVVQIFGPDGDLLSDVDGLPSTEWNGITAPSDGTYYVALHDVAVNNAYTLSLSYRLLERYLQFDVNNDEAVDVGDVNAVLEAILAGGDDASLDVNGDGHVDVGDVNAILTAILDSK